MAKEVVNKNIGNGIRHAGRVAVMLLVLLGIPLLAVGAPEKIIHGADAISSATVVLEQPSGEYVVLINGKLHEDKEALKTWEAFFRGEDIGFLFEDISCMVASSDASGLEMAKSFQSRMPENQMRVRPENPALLQGKAAAGLFDVIIASREMDEVYGFSRVGSREEVQVIQSEDL